jgi:hypothetical protein
MGKHYFFALAGKAGRCLITAGLLIGFGLASRPTRAQAPAWALATTGSAAAAVNPSNTRAVATDASGNVFVAGAFEGQLTFGSTVLTSAGGTDIFIAKYMPRTNTWAWAQRGGSSIADAAVGLAVSGNNVYLVGTLANTTYNSYPTTFGGTSAATSPVVQYGASPTLDTDIVLVKYVDQGSSATVAWTQVAGGTGYDYPTGVAVSGSSVYLTGAIFNNASNDNAVLFGGAGTVIGTAAQPGVSATASFDLLLAKYVDNGATATLGWTQVAGGTAIDGGNGIAVSGSNVYVTGYLTNNRANANAVLFGGSGTTPGTLPQYGASIGNSRGALLLAKYVDNGATATVGWTQVGGGTAGDYGTGVAVRGSSVYVTGSIISSSTNSDNITFGGTGTTSGTVRVYGASAYSSQDIIVAKYTDNGTTAALGWTQVGGGTNRDYGSAIAVSGNYVCVTGSIMNTLSNINAVVFGSNGGIYPGTASQPGIASYESPDVVVAQYLDNGSSAALKWTQVAGGAGNDEGNSLASYGNNLYVTGNATPTATFGSLAIAGTVTAPVGFLGNFVSLVLSTVGAKAAPVLSLYPNPASGAAMLNGAAPGEAVHIFDALGRRKAAVTANASGTASLPAGLSTGLYMVQAGASVVRWVIE